MSGLRMRDSLLVLSLRSVIEESASKQVQAETEAQLAEVAAKGDQDAAAHKVAEVGHARKHTRAYARIVLCLDRTTRPDSAADSIVKVRRASPRWICLHSASCLLASGCLCIYLLQAA